MSKRDHTALEEAGPVDPKSSKSGDSADKYKAANEEIHERVRGLQHYLAPADLLPNVLRTLYEKAKSDKQIQAAPKIGWCETLLEKRPDVQEALESAIKKGRYEDVPLVEYTPSTLVEKQSGQGAGVESRDPARADLASAWSRAYRGRYHEIMLKNINTMKGRGVYADSVALVQSSGTGKSRMVDELANLVFTIPFNVRHPSERQKWDAYPPEDTDVWMYIHELRQKGKNAALDRVKLFFEQLFSKVTIEVRKIFDGGPKVSPKELALRWKTHLSENNKRSQLYKRVVEACNDVQASLDSEASNISADPDPEFHGLLSALTTFCAFPKSHDVKVILYFDEAHEFDHSVQGDEDKKTIYDIVASSLNTFSSLDVFTIFLSTQSSLALLAPSPDMARSYRQEDTSVLHAPITETPFDCHPSFPLRPGQFQLEHLSELPFLARFGRPLFWTMIEAGKRETRVGEIMRMARVKLLRDRDISKNKHSDTAMLAILDVLITIEYEPRRELEQSLAHKTQIDMVASHMRTAFSVPTHRRYFRSGYPSEPFLAEAASRQIYHYMQQSDKHSESRMISILKKNFDSGLIDLGQRGEVVMRVLLRKAYIDAIVVEQADEISGGREPNFSKGCGFLQFLKALFADEFSTSILNAKPDNVVEQRALEDAFKDAVVRFTHFVKVVDDSAVFTKAMVSGFVRGSAFICRTNQRTIDMIIPVLLAKHEKLVETSMSALLIQVKRRKEAGSYIIDQNALNLFPLFPPGSTPRRPYVTLVAELGVTVTLGKSHLEIGKGGTRTSSRITGTTPPKHPRYSLRAYGCTHATWKVIGDTEREEYMQVLGTDNLLEDHPRQDKDSLQLVRQMLPFWDKDATWFSDEPGPAEIAQSSAAADVGDGTERPDSEEERMDIG